MGIVKTRLEVGRSLLVVVRNGGAASGATLSAQDQTQPESTCIQIPAVEKE